MTWKATPRWVRFLVRVPSAKKSWSRAYGYLPRWGNMSRPAVGQQATAVLDAICEPIATNARVCCWVDSRRETKRAAPTKGCRTGISPAANILPLAVVSQADAALRGRCEPIARHRRVQSIWKATPRWVRFLVRVPSAKKKAHSFECASRW